MYTYIYTAATPSYQCSCMLSISHNACWLTFLLSHIAYIYIYSSPGDPQCLTRVSTMQSPTIPILHKKKREKSAFVATSTLPMQFQNIEEVLKVCVYVGFRFVRNAGVPIASGPIEWVPHAYNLLVTVYATSSSVPIKFPAIEARRIS